MTTTQSKPVPGPRAAAASRPAQGSSPRPCFPACWPCRPTPTHKSVPGASLPATAAPSSGAGLLPQPSAQAPERLQPGWEKEGRSALGLDTCHGSSALSAPGPWRGVGARTSRTRAAPHRCAQLLCEYSAPCSWGREPGLISCTSFTALLPPPSPGAAALKTTGLFSSCSANSGAASSDCAGGAVHVRVSHRRPSGSAASRPHRFSTGQGSRQTTAFCPLLGHQPRGTRVSVHPGAGEAAKPPSSRADGDATWPRNSPGTTHRSAAVRRGHRLWDTLLSLPERPRERI